MRRCSVLGLLAFATLVARSSHAQSSDSENIKIVTTGEIRKIDEKNKTFQFKFSLDPAPSPNRGRGNGPQGGGRPGGIGGRRRGGIGYPGGNRFPAPAAADDNSKEVKVFTSASTSLKDAAKTDLQFSDLKKGDRVTVTAIHKGKGDDIEAIAVKRD